MPVSKKKPTTLISEGSTQSSEPLLLPEQGEFREYLRRLAVSAVQVLIEHVAGRGRADPAGMRDAPTHPERQAHPQRQTRRRGHLDGDGRRARGRNDGGGRASATGSWTGWQRRAGGDTRSACGVWSGGGHA